VFIIARPIWAILSYMFLGILGAKNRGKKKGN
jgi:hypothetical protein